ncbi:hypothetical protein QZH41_016662, partial [Actinostola sp. cb2023]
IGKNMNNTSASTYKLAIPEHTDINYNPGTGLVVFHVIILIILCLVAITGNAVVINVVLRDRRLHMPTFYFIVNLAVADILTSAIYIPFYIVAIVKQLWVLGTPFCKAHVFLISLGFNASLITLSFISFDRFLDIVFPLLYPIKMTSRRMRILVVFGWVHSIWWALGPLFKWGDYRFDTQSNTCRPKYDAEGWVNKSYAVCLVTICFVVPILVMVYCYARIFTVVEKHVKDIEQMSCSLASVASIASIDSSPRHDITPEVRKPKEIRAHKMILLIIVIFFICWAMP